MLRNDADRYGDWMQTASGGVFWPMDPRPEEIEICDIAHALSNLCRYAGHCRQFYSVAQHSVLVSHAVPREDALWGLLHDASEAYLADVPRPVKPFLPGYAEAEARVMAAVCARFRLPLEMPESVAHADKAILADEMAQLMASPPRPWDLPVPPFGLSINPLSPLLAGRFFLDRFFELTEAPDAG